MSDHKPLVIFRSQSMTEKVVYDVSQTFRRILSGPRNEKVVRYVRSWSPETIREVERGK